MLLSVIEFDEKSATEFQRLKKLYPRLGSMDLKIAAIAIANDAILLTRNLTDFGQIQELRAEDWTVLNSLILTIFFVIPHWIIL